MSQSATAEDRIFNSGVMAGLSKLMERFDLLTKDTTKGDPNA